MAISDKLVACNSMALRLLSLSALLCVNLEAKQRQAGAGNSRATLHTSKYYLKSLYFSISLCAIPAVPTL